MNKFIIWYSLVFGGIWLLSLFGVIFLPNFIPKIIPSVMLAIWFGGIAVSYFIDAHNTTKVKQL